MKGVLVLEDGSCFEGISIGILGERIGPIVLNTAVVGHQELMTDPTNAGKILVPTYPLIGNYGFAKQFYESSSSWVEALVIKEESRLSSNWQAEFDLNAFLQEESVVAISRIDTRTLAVQIRTHGEMLGLVSTEPAHRSDLVKKIQEYKSSARSSYIKETSVKKITELSNGSTAPRIAVIDLGVLNSFISQLKTLGWKITLLPYNTDAETILSLKPDAVMISNGPEEDEAIPGIVQVVRELVGKIPLLGISTGHEIICLALGATLEKMKVGHHGVNYPVKSASSYKGAITVQNHSLVVDEESLSNRDDIEITLRNVDDNSVEEIESRSLSLLATQYYPASPGFGEPNDVFKRFFDMTRKRKGIRDAKADGHT